MAYRIKKGSGGRPWKVYDGRKIVATSTSKAKAERHVNHRKESEKKKNDLS